jgi:hypothetical protein
LKIYLSVFFAHNKLGAAFYDSSSAIIYFIPDVEETSRFDITQQRKNFVHRRKKFLVVTSLMFSSSRCSTIDDYLFSKNK